MIRIAFFFRLIETSAATLKLSRIFVGRIFVGRITDGRIFVGGV